MPVDVILTVLGGEESASAIRQGGGLVGVRSSASTPTGARVEFVDWPWQLDDPSIEEHIRVVRDTRPRYAVAPDIQGEWGLEDVLDVARDLDAYADTVIVVAKDAAPSRVPRRYRLGVPFREGFETAIGPRSYPEYRGHGPIHILGGNPNEQLRLRDQYGFTVGSVDTPLPLAWADFGRVFMAAGGSGVEARDLTVTPIDLDLETRHDRIVFSTQNMVMAWNDRVIRVRVRDLSTFGGHGAPPALSPPDLVGGEEKREFEELTGKTYEEGLEERRRFEERMEREVAERLEGEERVQYDLFDPPAEWFGGESDTSPRGSDGGMASDREKQDYFGELQRLSDEEVRELGLGPGALEGRDESSE